MGAWFELRDPQWHWAVKGCIFSLLFFLTSFRVLCASKSCLKQFFWLFQPFFADFICFLVNIYDIDIQTRLSYIIRLKV